MAEIILSNNELIGASSVNVLEHIVQINPDIAKISFWVYVYRPIQFTESGQNPLYVPRTDVLNDSQGVVSRIVNSLPNEAQVGVFSEVLLNNGDKAHIPMMDFGIPKSDEGLGVVKERLQRAEIHNVWILETGESYHLYGKDLLSPQEWLNFMGTCLLTSVVHSRDNITQVADPRYIGHSLKRGGCVLRVTTRAVKSFDPKVVAFIP